MSKYWKNRAIQMMFDNMQSAEEEADKIAKFYKDASGYFQKNIQQIFTKYVTKHMLTIREAEQIFSMVKDATSYDELMQVLEANDGNIDTDDLKKYLEAPAYRHRIDRFFSLQAQVDDIMMEVYKLEKNHSDAFYRAFISDDYYRKMYDLQRRTGVAFNFAHVSKKQVDKLLHAKMYGENYSERIWKNTQQLAEDLRHELFINFITGRTDREASQIIEKRFGVGQMEARRLIRTESANLSAEIDMMTYKEAGIDKYQYMATLDFKTSTICRDLDGKIFPVSQAEVGKNKPPMHPWCRSTTIAVVSEKYLDRLKRSYRDPNTGEWSTIPMNMTYKEWWNKYIKGTKAEDLDENTKWKERNNSTS